MRRPTILFALLLTLASGPTLLAQSLWNPCGCPAQCGANGACGSQAACASDCDIHPGCGRGFGCCANLHDPAYFQPWNPRPFGLYNEQINAAQRHSGMKAQFAFYHIHFALDEGTGTWSLSQTGYQNAQKLARMWSEYPMQVIVEPTGRADWDGSRRELALQAMASYGVTVTPDMFVTGSSHILGLVPADPETIYYRRQELSPFMQGYIPSSSVGAPSVSSPSVSSPSTGGSGAAGGMSPNQQ